MPLECKTHRAYIYDRGGGQRLFELNPLTSVQWNRTRDDISNALAHIADPDIACQRQLARVHPHRHELVIYRDQDRVWEGPITRMAFERNNVTIEARDVMHYAFRTIARSGYDNSYPNIQSTIDRAINVLGELSRKEALDPPINVLPYVTAFRTPNDARTSKRTVPFQTTVWSEIDSMAYRAGLDYTVAGRRIMLFDTHTQWAITPTVTDNDFIGNTIVATMYGMEHATHAAVTSSEGIYGFTGANDPFYGEWEILDEAYDDTGTEAPTEAALLSQAVRNLDGRNPVPLHVRIPNNSQLNPEGVLNIRHLVPGVRIPLRATLLSLEVSQMQKLFKVRVTEAGGEKESVNLVMEPASKNDEPPEENE